MSDQVLPQPSALCGQDASHSLQPTQMRVHGVELHYIEAGRGEPLILLHGGQGDYRSWEPQLQALSPHYRVISYSRRYHYPNNNPLTVPNHSAYVEAEDLAAFMRQLHACTCPSCRDIHRRIHGVSSRRRTPGDGAQPGAGRAPGASVDT